MFQHNYNFPQFGRLEHFCYVEQRVITIAKAIRELCDQRCHVPFDPYTCTEKLNIRVRSTDLPKGLSGRIRFDLPVLMIELRNGESRRRHRFTLCHEIAHLCFVKHSSAYPHEYGFVNLCKKVRNREEQLCDWIAGELLMPAATFERRARLLTPSYDALTQLADMFDVSVQAVLTTLRRTAVWSTGSATWSIRDLDTCKFEEKPLLSFVVCKAIRNPQDRRQVTAIMRRILSETNNMLQENPCRSASLLQSVQKGQYRSLLVNGTHVLVKLHYPGNQLQAFVMK